MIDNLFINHNFRWETFAPLRLYVIRTLKSERDGMYEEGKAFLIFTNTF